MKRTPLKRGGPLRRKARIRPRNEERAAERRAKDFGPQAEHCRSLPCAACCAQEGLEAASHLAAMVRADPDNAFNFRRSDPHHEPPRGAGGT